MDVRTICLAILTRGDATGYEIKKFFETGCYGHCVEASFGSIYPALNSLTADGLATVRTEAQEKRPDRRIYSLTHNGRQVIIATLMKPLSEDKHRSPFLFAMLFSHLLPQEHVTALIDHYISQSEGALAQLNSAAANANTAGECFVIDFGKTLCTATLSFLRERRGNLESGTATAAR